MPPPDTRRVHFREMTDADLDTIARLLGDADVMQHYPRPKTRAEAQAWIDWNVRNYAEHGFGLWLLELAATGEPIGDCGLTLQEIGGEPLLEVGYHLFPRHQGHGYATEAAAACVDWAFETLVAAKVHAIIRPSNMPSRRLAKRLGMTVTARTTDRQGLEVLLYAVDRGCQHSPQV